MATSDPDNITSSVSCRSCCLQWQFGRDKGYPEWYVVGMPSIQGVVAYISGSNSVDLVYQRSTDNDQVNSVAAFSPMPATRIISVFPGISMEVSEYIDTSHTIPVGKELGVEICTVLDVLYR